MEYTPFCRNFVPKTMRRLKKNYYLALFCSTVGILGLIRWATGSSTVPSVAQDTENVDTTVTETAATQAGSMSDTMAVSSTSGTDSAGRQKAETPIPPARTAVSTGGGQRPHPIYSVPSYAQCFPDLQDVQITSARKHGVRPVKDRAEAELRKKELVYIGSSPYYKIDPEMCRSIPYLVPHAAIVLETIARNYMDSLHVKGIPLHKILVSSVLRTEDDVRKLMRTNPNASPESCHRYGTTFDISYNRYHTIAPPGEQRRAVQNDTLKWVLAEVLRDVRREGMCYIKYEVKQGCFHITAK